MKLAHQQKWQKSRKCGRYSAGAGHERREESVVVSIFRHNDMTAERV
jgi:hypothetical protein